MNRTIGRQGGATLVIALIMLVMLTLFAISAIRTGNIGFRIVANQQTQKLMEAAALEAIEQVVSNLGNFDPTTIIAASTTVAQTVCVNGNPPVVTSGSCISGTSVTISPARCISSRRSQYDSLTQPLATYDNVWEIVATVTDSATGAQAIYHQGVKMRMLSDSCPGIAL